MTFNYVDRHWHSVSYNLKIILEKQMSNIAEIQNSMILKGLLLINTAKVVYLLEKMLKMS